MNEYDEFWKDIEKDILNFESKELMLEYIKVLMGDVIIGEVLFSCLEDTLGNFQESEAGRNVLESDWYSYVSLQRKLMEMA